MWRGVFRVAAIVLPLATTGCLRHHLIHPHRLPQDVTSREQSEVVGNLRVHVEWAGPPGPGPLPTVIVHPEAGKTAREMRGVIWDLATRGWLAVAVDYARRDEDGGDFDETLMPWRSPGDPLAAIDLVLQDPRVDRQRLALLGFSQGGVFSLSIATQGDELASRSASVRALVAYYPVTDFELWLSHPTGNPIRRFIWRRIRSYFYARSGAADEPQFLEILRHASAVQNAERIVCPVLLIHGKNDRSASITESRRLRDRLAALGKPVELLEVPGEGHVFNFKHRAPATAAWERTIAFLDENVNGGGPRR